MNDTMINGLAMIGAATCLYGLFRLLSAAARRLRTPEKTAGTPEAAPSSVPDSAGLRTPAPEDMAKDDIVAIAAAVTMMMSSGYRIVHIDDMRNGITWTAEGRWMHQTSHNPH